MSVIRRGLPDPDPGEMADRLQRRANQVLALENQNMELAAKLGEAEHQLEGAVDLLYELAEAVVENQERTGSVYSHRVHDALAAMDAAGYRPSAAGGQ